MKFFLANKVGTGTQADPFRPDVPAGTPFVCTDGNDAAGVRGGVGGKFIVAIPDDKPDLAGATKLKKYHQLTAANQKKVDDYKAEKAKTVKDEAKLATLKAALPTDALFTQTDAFGWGDEGFCDGWQVAA